MTPKNISFIIVAIGAIIGWNVFLIQRDQKLFDAYNQPTPKEVYCSQLPQPHPDCNVE